MLQASRRGSRRGCLSQTKRRGKLRVRLFLARRSPPSPSSLLRPLFALPYTYGTTLASRSRLASCLLTTGTARRRRQWPAHNSRSRSRSVIAAARPARLPHAPPTIRARPVPGHTQPAIALDGTLVVHCQVPVPGVMRVCCQSAATVHTRHPRSGSPTSIDDAVPVFTRLIALSNDAAQDACGCRRYLPPTLVF